MPVRSAPAPALANYRFESAFTWGAEHPFLEELIPQLLGAVAPNEREILELESARWMFDNVFGQIGLYAYDGAWAVGPKAQPWLDHVRRGDIRSVMNGMEWAQPR